MHWVQPPPQPWSTELPGTRPARPEGRGRWVWNATSVLTASLSTGLGATCLPSGCARGLGARLWVLGWLLCTVTYLWILRAEPAELGHPRCVGPDCFGRPTSEEDGWPRGAVMRPLCHMRVGESGCPSVCPSEEPQNIIRTSDSFHLSTPPCSVCHFTPPPIDATGVPPSLLVEGPRMPPILSCIPFKRKHSFPRSPSNKLTTSQ